MNAVSIEVATARDANPSGVMFGGWLMQLADRIASVAASRYCGRRVATASVVNMRFVAPCYVGEFLTITAEVISSATTSMTVAARIDVEGVQARKHATSSRATRVCCAQRLRDPGADKRARHRPSRFSRQGAQHREACGSQVPLPGS